MTEDSSVPQGGIELVFKLNRAGLAAEIISDILEISLSGVQRVLSQSPDSQLQVSELIMNLNSKSNEFRCSNSDKLMQSPFIGADGRYYEQSVLENWIKSKVKVKDSQMPEENTKIPAVKFKEKIIKFSKLAICSLESCLKLKEEFELVITLAAECLSVLDPDNDFPFFHKVIAGLDIKQASLLFDHLKGFSRIDRLRRLQVRLIELNDFEVPAIALTKAFLIDPGFLEMREADFSSFKTLIKKTNLSKEVLDSVMEVAKLCDLSQLNKLRKTLETKDWDQSDRWRINELKFREAELRLGEGDERAAKLILGPLKLDPQLRERLLEFYDRVNWKQEKLIYLEQRYTEAVSKVDCGETTQYLAESLHLLRAASLNIFEDFKRNSKETIDQMKVEIQNLTDIRKSETELRLMAKEDAATYSFYTPTLIYSYQADTGILHWTNMITEVEHSRTIPSHIFQANSSLCALPDGSIYCTGGSDNSVVCIDPTTFTTKVKSAMISVRSYHNTIFHKGYLYAISGRCNSVEINQCEKFCVSLNRWEGIAPISSPCYNSNLAILEDTQSLYVLGSHRTSSLANLIQEYSITKDTWRVLGVRLPSTSGNIPTFKSEERQLIYFVQDSQLFELNPKAGSVSQIRPVNACISQFGSSFLTKGYLYCTNPAGKPIKIQIGGVVN